MRFNRATPRTKQRQRKGLVAAHVAGLRLLRLAAAAAPQPLRRRAAATGTSPSSSPSSASATPSCGWLQDAVVRQPRRRTPIGAAAALHPRPLAHRHDAAARAAHPRPAAHLPRHLPVPRAEPLPAHRGARQALPAASCCRRAGRWTTWRPAGTGRRRTSSPCACSGQPSPYLTIAFPNRPPQDQDAFDLDGLPPRELRGVEAGVRAVPADADLPRPAPAGAEVAAAHAAASRRCWSCSPDARFVHIVRDPYVVFPSTVNLWKSLYRHARPADADLRAGWRSRSSTTFTHSTSGWRRASGSSRRGSFHELRYEDLVADPVGRDASGCTTAWGWAASSEARPRLRGVPGASTPGTRRTATRR